MQAAHAHGVDVVIVGRLTNAVVELLQDGLTIGLIVPFSVALSLPFRRSGIVEEQRFAMTGGNHDAPLVCHLLTLGMTIESTRAGVHGRSQHVSFQTENQFADAVVGLRTYVAQVFLKGLGSPRLQSPVFIVEEDAAILNGWRLADIVFRVIEDTPVRLVNGYIGKPIPRTDTYRLAHVQHAVCQSSGIGAGDIQGPFPLVDGIPFPGVL